MLLGGATLVGALVSGCLENDDEEEEPGSHDENGDEQVDNRSGETDAEDQRDGDEDIENGSPEDEEAVDETYVDQPDAEVPIDVSDMELLFADTFQEDAINVNRWHDKYPWDARTHNYNGFAAPENAYIDGDVLVLEAEDEPREGKDYTTGVLSSIPQFSTGFIEGRIKVPPHEEGFWPAFWLTPYDKWPPEIDIFEFFGTDPCSHMRYHYRDDDGEMNEANDTYCDHPFSDGFHNYAVDWSEEQIAWLVDGEEQFRYEGEHVTTEEMTLIFNFGIDSSFLGEPESETLPARLEMDWVRVWQR